MKIDEKLSRKYLQKYPIFLIDGGALDGLKKPWADVSKFLKLVGFEPQIKNQNSDAYFRTKSKKDNFVFDSVALSDKACESVDFYITKHNDNSSLLKPNFDVLKYFAMGDKFEIVSQESISTDTIDNQLSKKSISFIDFIKLDTQGSELDILKGSAAILNKSVFGVEVEVNFIERYKNQNYFSDVDIFLRNLGFELYDLERRFAKRHSGIHLGNDKGQMTHGTALYIRNFKYVRNIISGLPNLEKKSYVFHYVIILAIYGYLDAAKGCLDYFDDFFSKEENTEMCVFLTKNDRKNFRLLGRRGSYKLSIFFAFLSNFFKPHSSIGVVGDSSLGNR